MGTTQTELHVSALSFTPARAESAVPIVLCQCGQRAGVRAISKGECQCMLVFIKECLT